MGFQIAFNRPNMPVIWGNANNGSELLVGQIVYTGGNKAWAGTGFAPAGAASGIGDNTARKTGLAVVVGTNLKTPSYNSTYKTEAITAGNPHGNTTEYVLQEGLMAAKGDPCAMVAVVPIFPDTILKGPIFNATFGTAITVGNVTSNNTSGNSIACSAGCADFTPIASQHSIYFRTGLNKGIYRVGSGTSATTLTTAQPFPYDIIVGDKVVTVPMRLGHSQVQFDTNSTFITSGDNAATNSYYINVWALNLETAGEEYCLFNFQACHFGALPQV